MVVEGVPIGVGDDSSMATEERDLVGYLAALGEGDDSEGAAATSLPIDREELGVCLWAEGLWLVAAQSEA